MKKRYDKYLERVQKFYRDNYEFYHTIHHIEKMFELYEEHRKFLKANMTYNEEELLWSIAYHDSFYIPGVDYNEEISSNIALHDLNGVNGDFLIFAVKENILSTKVDKKDINFSKISYDEEKILHDLDWFGFSDYFLLKRNERKIAKEANQLMHFNYNEIEKNQLEFYKTFCHSDIFLTDCFKHLNEEAKENLRVAISDIEGR